jgi:hypothetical protein
LKTTVLSSSDTYHLSLKFSQISYQNLKIDQLLPKLLVLIVFLWGLEGLWRIFFLGFFAVFCEFICVFLWNLIFLGFGWLISLDDCWIITRWLLDSQKWLLLSARWHHHKNPHKNVSKNTKKIEKNLQKTFFNHQKTLKTLKKP